MVTPGKYNKLNITKIVDFGVYLDGGEYGEILLPMKWVPENTKPTDSIEVFIYFDSTDRIIATTMKPFAVVGEFASLKVKAVNDVGAFLDWGLEKDLLLPYREQTHVVQKDQTYPVHVYSDDKGRIAASMHLEKFIDKETGSLTEGEEVDLLLYAATDLGFKAIINNRYEGIVYANEVFQQLSKGQRIKGYIKKLREDGKIDLSLYKSGYRNKISDHTEMIIKVLKDNDGFLPLNDKSSPEEIYSKLGMSKRNFKQAAGSLFKEGTIVIKPDGLFLK